jgi:hypothetical protein
MYEAAASFQGHGEFQTFLIQLGILRILRNGPRVQMFWTGLGAG